MTTSACMLPCFCAARVDLLPVRREYLQAGGTDTDSGPSKVAVTGVGACGTTELSAGLVLTIVACAQAAVAPASRTNPAKTSVAIR